MSGSEVGDGVQRFRARLVWIRPGEFHAPGELVIAGGRVAHVGPIRGGRIPPRAILPGLVDAHVHLQIPPLSRSERNFLSWVRAVMGARDRLGESGAVDRAVQGLASLVADGVTGVGEIDSTGLSKRALSRLPIGGACYQEVTGFHLGPSASGKLVRSRIVAGTRHCQSGLSPHAPYSVSRDLFRAARQRGVPLAVHVAETEEEVEFLRDGRGPFRDLLVQLGRLPKSYRAPGLSPVAYLDSLGMVGPGTTMIHCQHITRDDAATIAHRQAPVVVCPGTIRYFRRSPPPVPEWLAAGIPVALGTDSIASNTRLSMCHEMGLARRMWPELTSEQVLAMATDHGGSAVQRRSLGTLRRGAPAHFLTLAMSGDMHNCLDRFTRGRSRPEEVWLAGVPASQLFA